MKIFKGETGLDQSWQQPFLPEIKCKNCDSKARIMFTAIEGNGQEGKGEYICDLHETTGKPGGLWLHDACAVAVYLCEHCFEVSAEINQA